MKAIRWLLKLVLVMITLPLILAVWLAKWFVVFLHHCSAWFFYLLGSVLLVTAMLSFLMQQSQGMEALQNFTVYVPKVDEHFVGSLAVIPLQLLGYYVSVAKGLDVDKPRNLAKSVTVE